MCVCVCVRACVRACVCACVRACVRACVAHMVTVKDILAGVYNNTSQPSHPPPPPLRAGEGLEDRRRPVIIHRAILGSVERMIAILTENFGGKW